LSQCVPRNNSMYSDIFVCVPIFGLQCDLTFFQFDYTTNENLLPGILRRYFSAST
jgi:hypothetical protein